MKVGILCPFYKEHAIGGVETVIRSLMHRLPERGIEASMVPFMLGTGLPYDNPFFAPLIGAKAAMSALSREIGRFDIIHSHHPFVTLPFALRRKTVMTFHVYSEDFYAPEGNGAGPINWLIRKGIHMPEYLGARTARGITAVSDHVRRKYAHKLHLPVDKISVVHNGIDLKLVDSSIGANPYPEGGINIFSLGRLWRPKGFHALLRAAGRLKIKGLRVYIAGPKEDGQYAEELAGIARSKNIGFSLLGPIGEADKYRCLHHADLVVLPSRFEGLSIVAIEALAASAAILASDIPPFREVLGDAAMFFRCGDDADLADRMERALSDAKGLRGMRSRSRRRRRLFSEESMVDGYVQAYRDACL